MDNNASEAPARRFAVASFDTRAALSSALRAYGYRDRAGPKCNCLALSRVVADDPSLLSHVPAFCALALADAANIVVCSKGPIADYLRQQVKEGATTLSSALGSWLIRRHAVQISQAVEQGKIVLFLQLDDTADEQRAYQALLVNSSGSVGVHDMMRA